MRLTSFFFTITFGVLFFFRGQAQEVPKPDKQFILVTAYSPSSIIFFGKTPNASTSIIKLEIKQKTDREILGNPLYYQFGIIPFIQFNYPKRDEDNRMALTNGFGISPIGLGINKSISKNFAYNIFSYSGIILVDKRFPTDNGRRLNYTFSLSTELIFKTNDIISLSLGYKFHHISNAQTGTENPGIDSNFLTLSLILSK